MKKENDESYLNIGDDLDKIQGIGIYEFGEDYKIDLEFVPTLLIVEEVDYNEFKFRRYYYR